MATKKRYFRFKRGHRAGGWFRHAVEHSRAAMKGWRRKGIRFARKNQNWAGVKYLPSERTPKAQAPRPIVVTQEYPQAYNTQPNAWAVPVGTRIKGLGKVAGYADTKHSMLVIESKEAGVRMKDGRVIPQTLVLDDNDPRIRTGMSSTIKTKTVNNFVRGLRGELPERLGGVVKTASERKFVARQKKEAEVERKRESVDNVLHLLKNLGMDRKVSEKTELAETRTAQKLPDFAKSLGIQNFRTPKRYYDEESKRLALEKEAFNRNIKNTKPLPILYMDPSKFDRSIILFTPEPEKYRPLKGPSSSSIEKSLVKMDKMDKGGRRYIPPKNVDFGPAKKIQYKGSTRQYNNAIWLQHRLNLPLSTPIDKPHKEGELTLNKIKKILRQDSGFRDRQIKMHKRTPRRKSYYAINEYNTIVPRNPNTVGGLRLQYHQFVTDTPNRKRPVVRKNTNWLEGLGIDRV